MAQQVQKPGETQFRPLERKSTLAVFTSLIEVFEFPDGKQLNAQLIKDIAAWRANDEGLQSSNRLGWHSPRSIFQREEPAIRELCRRSVLGFQNVVRRHVAEFDISKAEVALEGWVNVNEQGAFNAPHGHSANDLSAVYYVAVPETPSNWSGALEFFNPVGAVTPLTKFGRLMLPDKWRLHPVAGQLVVFPSYIKHWVYPNQEDEERISVAINIKVKELGVDVEMPPEQQPHV